nr:hypothetical protein [Rubidibacter lacunae]
MTYLEIVNNQQVEAVEFAQNPWQYYLGPGLLQMLHQIGRKVEPQSLFLLERRTT